MDDVWPVIPAPAQAPPVTQTREGDTSFCREAPDFVVTRSRFVTELLSLSVSSITCGAADESARAGLVKSGGLVVGLSEPGQWHECHGLVRAVSPVSRSAA